MKSKRYTTEQKIRILREAEKADQSIVEVRVSFSSDIVTKGFNPGFNKRDIIQIHKFKYIPSHIIVNIDKNMDK